MPHSAQKRWSYDDLLTLVIRRERQGERADWKAVAAHLPGRTPLQCRRRYELYCVTGTAMRTHRMLPGKEISASEQQVAEREHRNNARLTRDQAALNRGDITPFFFGDPPPGYSALDRRQGATR